MNNIIEIKDLSFKYNTSYIFEKFNLKIKKNTFLTIIGPGFGKTTLCRILNNELNYIGNIKINGELSLITDEINYNGTVLEYLNNTKPLVNINHLMDLNINNLSYSETVLVSILKKINDKKDIIILDNVVSKLDKNYSDLIFKLLIKLNKDNITIINITNDIEESLYSKELLIINNNDIVIYEDIANAFIDETIFKQNNINLPFMVNLSNKLRYYDLIKDNILDMNEMVDYIWK